MKLFWKKVKEPLITNFKEQNLLYHTKFIEDDNIKKSIKDSLKNYKSIGNISQSFIRANNELFSGL